MRLRLPARAASKAAGQLLRRRIGRKARLGAGDPGGGRVMGSTGERGELRDGPGKIAAGQLILGPGQTVQGGVAGDLAAFGHGPDGHQGFEASQHPVPEAGLGDAGGGTRSTPLGLRDRRGDRREFRLELGQAGRAGSGQRLESGQRLGDGGRQGRVGRRPASRSNRARWRRARRRRCARAAPSRPGPARRRPRPCGRRRSRPRASPPRCFSPARSASAA